MDDMGQEEVVLNNQESVWMPTRRMTPMGHDLYGPPPSESKVDEDSETLAEGRLMMIVALNPRCAVKFLVLMR